MKLGIWAVFGLLATSAAGGMAGPALRMPGTAGCDTAFTLDCSWFGVNAS